MERIGELVCKKQGITSNQENCFIRRLCDCLDTSFKKQGVKAGPETWMLQAYYELKKEKGIDFPALIPQVYLYYDPLTIKERGYRLFEHQKMDFLVAQFVKIIFHNAKGETFKLGVMCAINQDVGFICSYWKYREDYMESGLC